MKNAAGNLTLFWERERSGARRLWRQMAPFLDRDRLEELEGEFLKSCAYLRREGLSLERAWKAGLLDMRLPEPERRLMVKQLKERNQRRKHATQ